MREFSGCYEAGGLDADSMGRRQCAWQAHNACAHAQLLQSCPTLCSPMDHSLPGSSVHGILQARILEWVAIPSSQGIFPIQGLNLGLLLCRGILYPLSRVGGLDSH